MKDVHVDEWLIDHVRGELDPADRARVDAHLSACDDCRASRERFGALMTELARTAPAPPPIHWGTYRAELRERLERRISGIGGGAAGLWAWLARPLPALVAAGLVALLVMTGLPASVRTPDPAIDNTILASQLDMIARLDVVQQLDLLEDFNVIGELDELPEPQKG
jgi:anti-sigma factor RsiW